MSLAVRLAIGSLIMAGGILAVAHGCASSSGGAAPKDAELSDAGNLFDVYASDAPHCVIPPKPSQVPDGWELYTDYDPCCLLYAPSAPQNLPPPLQWKSCNPAWSGDAGIDGGGCKIIDQPAAGSPEFGASVRGGVVSLATGEFIDGLYADVIADADGPVHQALLETDRKASQCTPFPQDMRDGKYVYAMYPPNDFNGGGFLAGDVNEFHPSFAHHFSDALTHGVVVGTLGVLDVDETDTFRLYEWAQSPKVINNPQDVGLQYSFAFFSSNALFWAATNATYLRVGEYTDSVGAIDFLTFGNDWTQGAGDLGSDGQNMVWVEASGRANETAPFATASYMTAPFTTDPTKIVKRRLRSEDPRGLSALPTTVGCGYAARSTNDSSGHINGIRIVRISDGTSWQLLDNLSVPWGWIHPLAITCDEIFVSVLAAPNANNIARVRISSLGPGIPAD